jgi:hypothetical protein
MHFALPSTIATPTSPSANPPNQSQAENEAFLAAPDCQRLMKELWERQRAAMSRAAPEAVEAAQTARLAAATEMTAVTGTPSFVKGGVPLKEHQLEVGGARA